MIVRQDILNSGLARALAYYMSVRLQDPAVIRECVLASETGVHIDGHGKTMLVQREAVQ